MDKIYIVETASYNPKSCEWDNHTSVNYFRSKVRAEASLPMARVKKTSEACSEPESEAVLSGGVSWSRRRPPINQKTELL